MIDIFKLAENNDLDHLKKCEFAINTTDDRGQTLLHYAVLGSSIEVINYLLSKGILVNHQSNIGETALFDCARKGKVQIAKMLIMAHVQINIANKRGELPIHLASSKGNTEMLKLLVENGSFIKNITLEEKTPIHYAILSGNLAATEYLINVSGGDFFVTDVTRNNYLHYATRTSNTSIINLFLKKGVDINALNDQLETPLFNAVRYGTRDTVKLLLDSGAYSTIYNRRYETSSDIATIYNKEDINQYIDEYTSRSAYQQILNSDVLSIAVLNRDLNLVRKLVKEHTAISKNKLGLSALDYAKKYNQTAMTEILREALAK